MVNFYTYFITCNSTATISDVIGTLKKCFTVVLLEYNWSFISVFIFVIVLTLSMPVSKGFIFIK